jgi:hypothetical protein
MHLGCVLYGDEMVADTANGANRPRRIGKERCLEHGVGPGLGDRISPDMRTDPGLVSFDNVIETSRFYISLFNENGLQGAYSEIHLGELRTVIVVVIVCGHGRNLRERKRFAYVYGNNWGALGHRQVRPPLVES